MQFSRISLLFASAALAVAQQRPQQRDLKVESIEAPPPAPKAPSIPRSYAVVVGISRYKNLPENLQLKFAERDAQSIYTILISPEGGNFKAENVHVLTGEKATLAGLRREIDTWLPGIAREDDRVLIYFAGHGFVFNGKAYLAPFDIDTSKIGATGYPMDDLGSIVGARIRAKSKILLTDACHSGAISPEDTQHLNRRLADLNSSLFSLTASRDRERSFESADLGGGHGVFTYYVVKGLEGLADTSHDGIVSADELAEYVHTQVREATGAQQNPTSEKGSFDPNMLLAYVPANAAPGAPPAPKYGTLVFESNMDGVEVFVDGKTAGVVAKGQPLTLPGIPPGEHTVQGVHNGYEPDGPRQEMVYPGRTSTVSIKILIPRRRPKAAIDSLEKGLELYLKGYEQNYRKAAAQFEEALRLDPTYSQAAYYAARTYNALFDEARAQEFYKRAIAIDPDYLEARANYAGMLCDIGAVDEAIRQLNVVLTREPANTFALTQLAQAYRNKDLYPQAIEAARKAISLNPASAEPNLWLGDSLRRGDRYADAEAAYSRYLQLSDFDSKLGGKLNYYVLGFLVGMGKKKRAAEEDIWKDLRSLAYFGLCDCERKLSRFDQAIQYCQRALTYDPSDPFAHYALGLSFMHKAQDSNSYAELDPALKHLQATVAINPDLSESDYARKNIAAIQQALKVR
jgi:tetratricopeptide (TPR) repeat protein